VIRGIGRRLRAVDNEEGVTLVELIVAMIITGFVLTLTASFFITTTKVTTSSVQTGNSSAVASNAIYEISNVVHQASTIPVSGGSPLLAVNTASTNKLVIYSYVDVSTGTNPTPTRVTFDATGANLVETRCVATASGAFWVFSSCASTLTRTIGGNIVAPTGTQNNFFSYLNSTGGTIAMVSGSVPPASLGSIASIQVSPNIQAAGSQTPAVYLTSNVGMPNLGLQIATP
jgi:type II secretory pathway pseudopilin PulG